MGFFHAQLKERSLFHYPPFYRLIRVVCKHRDRTKVEKAASDYAELIKRSLQGRVLGPNKPVVERVQLQYIREILLKLENGLSPQKIRDILKNAEEKLRQETDLRQVTLYYDVDPL